MYARNVTLHLKAKLANRRSRTERRQDVTAE